MARTPTLALLFVQSIHLPCGLAHRAADGETYLSAGNAINAEEVSDSTNWTANPAVRAWPSTLSANYSQAKKIACGMHGCAWLAKQTSDNVEVVIKVADEDGLEEECGEMRWMRYAACSKGAEVVRLHEAYLPSCNEFGKLSLHRRYLAMPVAGSVQIASFAKKNDLTIEQQKMYFAQLVAGIHALHAAGLRHLDLNGGNVMIEGDELSLIDFGLLQKETCEGRCRRGMSRDGNGIFRWASVLAKCPYNAQFSKSWWVKAKISAQKIAQENALACLKERWNPDDSFVIALQKVFEGNLQTSADQHVEGLFKTDFVQKHLPEIRSRFAIAGTENCHTWDKEKLADVMRKNGAMEPN